MKNLVLLLILLNTGNLFAQIPNTLSKSEKVYGLSKFWQEVNYNFIYLYKIDRKAWDIEYKKLIAQVQETNNDYDYYRLLQKFCALLKDGHTNVYFPKEVQDKIQRTNFGEYRIFLSNIDGKAIITRINSSKKRELPIGTEIIQVNKLKTSLYVKEKVIPYISSSTDHIIQDWGISRLLEGPIGTTFDLEIKLPNGEIKSLKLTHSKSNKESVYPAFQERELLDFTWLEKDVAYLSLNSFSDPQIDSLFLEKLPELYKAKKLIIDLRYNGGGRTDVGMEIFQYFTNDTILYGSKSESRLHIPTYKAWGMWIKEKDSLEFDWAKQADLSYRNEFYHKFPYEPDTIHLKSKRIVVPTVILIGHNTASAAEDFLIFTDNQKHITKIGEATFGSTGQPMLFDLPNGGSARICTKKDTYPNGKEFVGYGILPDIKVKKNLSHYLENKDPVLEKAIEFIQNKE